jgi:hypothetical protein
VAAIFPEHFQSLTIALKNHIFYELFRTKLSQVCLEEETKRKRHVPANINQQEATRAVIVSRLRAGLTAKEILNMKHRKEYYSRRN